MISNEDVRLQIGNEFFTSFSGGQIVLSFEDVSNSFSFDMWGIQPKEGVIFPYKEGADAKVFVGNKLLIDGVAESIGPHYSIESGKIQYNVSLAGRTLSGQIVDCCANATGMVFENRTLLQICQTICKPFGLTVILDASIAEDTIINNKFPKFGIQIGEKAFDSIQRAAKLRGAIINTSTGRDIRITRASDTVRNHTIIGGMLPVLNASRAGSYTERYSSYLLKGQTVSTNQWYGDKAANGEAVVTDAEIQRYRPYVVLGESQEGKDSLRRRAEWERNVRAGRSSRLTYTMAGWRDSAGELWMPNTSVSVKDPLLDIDKTLLITRVTFILGRATLHAGLELCNKDAFLPEAQPAKSVAKKTKKGDPAPKVTGDANLSFGNSSLGGSGN